MSNKIINPHENFEQNLEITGNAHATDYYQQNSKGVNVNLSNDLNSKEWTVIKPVGRKCQESRGELAHRVACYLLKEGKISDKLKEKFQKLKRKSEKTHYPTRRMGALKELLSEEEALEIFKRTLLNYHFVCDSDLEDYTSQKLLIWRLNMEGIFLSMISNTKAEMRILPIAPRILENDKEKLNTYCKNILLAFKNSGDEALLQNISIDRSKIKNAKEFHCQHSAERDQEVNQKRKFSCIDKQSDSKISSPKNTRKSTRKNKPLPSSPRSVSTQDTEPDDENSFDKVQKKFKKDSMGLKTSLDNEIDSSNLSNDDLQDLSCSMREVSEEQLGQECIEKFKISSQNQDTAVDEIEQFLLQEPLMEIGGNCSYYIPPLKLWDDDSNDYIHVRMYKDCSRSFLDEHESSVENTSPSMFSFPIY